MARARTTAESQYKQTVSIMEKQKETLAIEGMTCGSCVRHVRTALEQIDGVEVASITIGSVEVDYDASVIGRDAIIEAIREEGYGVRG